VRKVKTTVRRYFPVLIGCIVIFAASNASAQQNGNGDLGQILNSYQTATNSWISQLLVYAQDLFLLLAGIEFAWTAVILLLEQHSLEGWVAAFIRKLMWISFFYAVLIYAPTWIPAIVNSLTQIGQNVGGTGALTPDGILGDGLNLGGQVIGAAGSVNVGLFTLGNFSWMLLLGAIAVVIILCYVAIALQFVMTQIEGYIVISAGMMYLGFGGSRWTSNYVEKFLGTAVTTGVRLMVFYLIIGLGQTLTLNTWVPEAYTVAGDVNSGNYLGAANAAFLLAAGVIIFTVLCFRLPKLVASVISGSSNISAGDLLGTISTLVGGAATVASLAAGPEMGAAKAGAGASKAGAGASKAGGSAESMSASHASGGHSGSSMGSGGASFASASPQSSAPDVAPPQDSGSEGGGYSEGAAPFQPFRQTAASVSRGLRRIQGGLGALANDGGGQGADTLPPIGEASGGA
jgi:type IV secretion system protein TrbL